MVKFSGENFFVRLLLKFFLSYSSWSSSAYAEIYEKWYYNAARAGLFQGWRWPLKKNMKKQTNNVRAFQIMQMKMEKM